MLDIEKELIDLKGNAWSAGVKHDTPFQLIFSDQADKNIDNILKSIPAWVSVEDREPIVQGHYFCVDKYGWIGTSTWNPHKRFRHEHITHWLDNLPSLPNINES